MKEKIPLRTQRNCRWAVRARVKPHGMDMENYLPLLQTTSLFAGLEQPALRMLLRDLCAVVRSYGRGETLVQAGHSNRRVGVVLSGTIQAYRPAPGGTHLPITHMEAGGRLWRCAGRLQPGQPDNGGGRVPLRGTAAPL